MSAVAKNVILLMSDQERTPPYYEPSSLKNWRQKNLTGRNKLMADGIEFQKHYTASTACVPSRASLFTGQYTSVHGVHQTTGGAKQHDDERLKWLEPKTLPTMGDYFRAAGFDTLYKGKWHISEEDVHDENGFAPQAFNNQEVYDSYIKENKLGKFGFDGWVGPEPHGMLKDNSGTTRDIYTTKDVIAFLKARNEDKSNNKPFFITCCLVNPHDVMFYPLLQWVWDEGEGDWGKDFNVPYIPEPPSRREDLSTKPSPQAQFNELYKKMFFNNPLEAGYRNLYHNLIKTMDAHVENIYDALKETRFYQDTLVVFSSDHGDTLGSHGGIQQKFHQAYEETIRVPLVISCPQFAGKGIACDALTSHVDLLPTLLRLVGADPVELEKKLKVTHSEVHGLPGKDLTPLISALTVEPSLSSSTLLAPLLEDQIIYFETFDEISRGSLQQLKVSQSLPFLRKFWHFEHDHILGPPSIQVIVLKNKIGETWKFARYFDDPNFNWSHPHDKDEYIKKTGPNRGQLIVRTKPLDDEYELYNLTVDPSELNNLAFKDGKRNPALVDAEIEKYMKILKNEQEKRNINKNRKIYKEPWKLREKQGEYDFGKVGFIPGRAKNPLNW